MIRQSRCSMLLQRRRPNSSSSSSFAGTALQVPSFSLSISSLTSTLTLTRMRRPLHHHQTAALCRRPARNRFYSSTASPSKCAKSNVLPALSSSTFLLYSTSAATATVTAAFLSSPPSTILETTHCEQRVVTETGLVVPPVHHGVAWKDATVVQKAQRVWRLVKRLVKLTVTLAPVATLYPLYYLLTLNDNDNNNNTNSNDKKEDAHVLVLRHADEDDQLADSKTLNGRLRGWYLRLCLRCVEHSGAAVIKLLQWSSSRPDLFGHDFCRIFSKLQDDTTPHSWRHTCRLMQEAYGSDWRERIQLDEILGSGCIGQVYKGKILNSNNAEPQAVAVKVLHPAVQDDIDADLDLLRVAVRLAPHLPGTALASLKWLNLEGVVEEFAHLLKLQIDLRREADNLRRFNENFKDNDAIQFPQLIADFGPTENTLVESFCEGVPVVEFCRLHRDEQPLLTRMCNQAIRAVCQMIFLDNMVHGDLHPGNVYVSPDGKKFILFDVGIVNEYSDQDHQTIVDILAAFIRKQGRIAGRRMIDDSNNRLRRMEDGRDHALEEEKYIDKIEALTIAASTSGYFMEHLGTYITYICESAAQHHVMLNPSFVTAALAVKLEEGIALAMDPSCNIPKVAIPIIVESERRRFAQSASESLGLTRLKKTIFGTSSGASENDAKKP